MERALCVSRLPVEPDRDDTNSIHVVLRLPSGHRLERRFRESDKLQVRERQLCFSLGLTTN